MSKRFTYIATLAAAIFVTGSAVAVPFSNTVSCSDVTDAWGSCLLREDSGAPYSYQHNLGVTGPFSNATFSITFRDDQNATDTYFEESVFEQFGNNASHDYREDVTVTFDGGSGSWDISGDGDDIIDDSFQGNVTFDYSGDISAWLSGGVLDVSLVVDNLIDSVQIDFFGETCLDDECIADIYFVSSTVNYSVPEPGSIALLSLGMVGLGLARRKAKS